MTPIGDGDLNMPFEEDPGFGTDGQINLGLGDTEVRGGLLVVAGVTSDHGIPELEPDHPIPVFRFARPDGTLRSLSLIVTPDELRDLKRVVSGAVDGAISGARELAKKRRGR